MPSLAPSSLFLLYPFICLCCRIIRALGMDNPFLKRFFKRFINLNHFLTDLGNRNTENVEKSQVWAKSVNLRSETQIFPLCLLFRRLKNPKNRWSRSIWGPHNVPALFSEHTGGGPDVGWGWEHGCHTDRACSKQASAAEAVVAGEMGVLRKCVCVNGDRWPGCLFYYSR